jgi:laccase
VVDHNFTIIAMDAVYTFNLNANMLVLASGQTVDALMTTNTITRSYYMEVLVHTPSS